MSSVRATCHAPLVVPHVSEAVVADVSGVKLRCGAAYPGARGGKTVYHLNVRADRGVSRREYADNQATVRRCKLASV